MKEQRRHTTQSEQQADHRVRQGKLVAELISSIRADAMQTGEPMPNKLIVYIQSPLGDRTVKIKPTRWERIYTPK